MMKVALTGSIGMGKSTVGAMFERAGIPVFDADAEVHRLQSPGSPLLDVIEARFPGVVVDGALDRDILSARVLAAPEELAALEAIVHPALKQGRDQFIAHHADAPILMFDIPLLFETGGEKAFDKVVVVSAPADVQRARVLRRPSMTTAKFDAILARQLPDREKRKRADFIVDTSGPLDATEARVGAIVACLRTPDAR